jgi:hypothetical protein
MYKGIFRGITEPKRSTGRGKARAVVLVFADLKLLRPSLLLLVILNVDRNTASEAQPNYAPLCFPASGEEVTAALRSQDSARSSQKQWLPALTNLAMIQRYDHLRNQSLHTWKSASRTISPVRLSGSWGREPLMWHRPIPRSGLPLFLAANRSPSSALLTCKASGMEAEHSCR